MTIFLILIILISVVQGELNHLNMTLNFKHAIPYYRKGTDCETFRKHIKPRTSLEILHIVHYDESVHIDSRCIYDVLKKIDFIILKEEPSVYFYNNTFKRYPLDFNIILKPQFRTTIVDGTAIVISGYNRDFRKLGLANQISYHWCNRVIDLDYTNHSEIVANNPVFYYDKSLSRILEKTLERKSPYFHNKCSTPSGNYSNSANDDEFLMQDRIVISIASCHTVYGNLTIDENSTLARFQPLEYHLRVLHGTIHVSNVHNPKLNSFRYLRYVTSCKMVHS
ncbi:unnamed protein product [Caenorhabditis bovis]|uniref:Receptor L-domain domain-containing protein n=1 Tax=Caenorhabditis bovis TaxID=2654633 RepID=A0A8S1E4V6_9PELO|nr:unnamed protein product [Caenorhabditis bovis]